MRHNWKLWIFLAMAAALALVAPGTRTTLLPFALVAACPLAMLLMGAGMAGAARRANHSTPDAATPSPTGANVTP